MKNRPSLSSKHIATELANLMITEDADPVKIEELFSRLKCPVLKQSPGHPPSIARAGNQSQAIGIWQPAAGQRPVSYKRDPLRQAEWYLWADTPEINPKGDKKRILLLGESVARGFLYDPYYNVAKEMRSSLSVNQAVQNTEVIDLAKIGIHMDELLDLSRSSVALDPDAVVIFAGNNWFFSANAHIADFDALMELYKEKSYPGIKSFLEEKLAALVKDFLKQVERLYKQKNIPVIFVIPEFNLKDWKSAATERIPAWSGDDSIEKWLRTEEDIRALSPRTGEFETLAAQMIELDRSNPLGYELLGKYCLEHDRLHQARKYFEEARDTALFNRSNNSMPRRVAKIRRTILDEVPACGMITVDLEQVFQEAFPDTIPDRRLFLDNCHLTVDAIKVAVRHITGALTRAIPGLTPPAGMIKTPDIAPGNHVKAVAHFSAAIYNAHHGQPYEIIAYHCHQAVSLSPAIKDTMTRYMDFAARKTNSYLCKSFQDMMLTGELTQYEGGLSLGHPRNQKLLDASLIDAITASLHTAGIAPGIRNEVARLQIEEYLAGVEKINLLESYYWKDGYVDFAAYLDAGYLQVRSARNTFTFVSEAGMSLSFQMTYRTPLADPPGRWIKIFLNDNPDPIGKLSMSKSWKTLTFTIDRELVLQGTNRLGFTWSYVPQPMQIAHPSTSNTFLRSLFPVYGEIYSLDMIINDKTANNMYEPLRNIQDRATSG